MKKNGSCPVCLSDYLVFVQNVVGRRTDARIPQFFCMDCKSFSNLSGYRETDSVKEEDCQYLVDRQDHIAALQNQLMLELHARLLGVKTVLEIGCGIGLFLKAATYFGSEEYGFDVNPFAIKYAQETVGVRCELGLFDASHARKYDLIVAIGVFEHLETPRPLFQEMVNHLNRDGAIYINVPFVEREHWKYLWLADERSGAAPPDPFYDNDVHIVHFSIDGLKRMGLSMGARSAEYFVSADVVSNSPGGAYTGVLFKF